MKDFFTYLALFSVATILVFLLRGLYLKNLSIQNKKNAGKNLKKQKLVKNDYFNAKSDKNY